MNIPAQPESKAHMYTYAYKRQCNKFYCLFISYNYNIYED